MGDRDRERRTQHPLSRVEDSRDGRMRNRSRSRERDERNWRRDRGERDERTQSDDQGNGDRGAGIGVNAVKQSTVMIKGLPAHTTEPSLYAVLAAYSPQNIRLIAQRVGDYVCAIISVEIGY